MTPSVSNSEQTPTRHASEGSFSALARRISGWTTNLLATAIVLVGGLGLGWQVLAWWHDEPQPVAANGATMTDANLPLVGESREFWTTHGPLKMERLAGSQDDSVAAMRTFCRDILPPPSAPAPGPGEEQFVAKLKDATPLEEAGDLVLYQPRGQSAMVVAVSRSRQRIVGWSFALEAEEGTWSLYHFQPTPQMIGVMAPEPKAGNSP